MIMRVNAILNAIAQLDQIICHINRQNKKRFTLHRQRFFQQADRNRFEEARIHQRKTVRREKSEALRYMSYYKIDIGDLSIYDIVIDSEKWNQYQILDILRVAIDSLLGPE